MESSSNGARNWYQGIWQAAAIFMLAAVIGLTVNQFRPGQLPLVADWSMQAQVAHTGTGENLAIALEEATTLFFSQAAVFIDARSENLYQLGHIAGARNLPWEDFDNRFGEVMRDLPPESTIITYCDGESCSLSKELAFALLGNGYLHARVLLNGWALWQQSGLPVE